MTEPHTCPVCRKVGTCSLIERENLITMQNYVYRDYESARNSPVGDFLLRACDHCGFAYNALFDKALMRYDPNYDNLVPSDLFLAYYEEIAQLLYEKHDLENQFVVEIGCGKGTFLRTLCRQHPSVRGLGIDPSYEASNSDRRLGNLEFIQDSFKQDYLSESPALVICRHVLEHILDPVSFLASIRETLKERINTPLFVEVPNLNWIIDNNAFWDFCYEHCNYFTPNSLKNTVKAAGFDPQDGGTSFGGQYQWITCINGHAGQPDVPEHGLVRRLAEYASREKYSMAQAAARLREARAMGDVIAVWGMATKGVVFCNVIDASCNLIDYCIDINPNKDGAFVPRTGHVIRAPDALENIEPTARTMIIVMNPNYFSEIKEKCKEFSLNASFVDAGGKQL